jgi:hypothetical protein
MSEDIGYRPEYADGPVWNEFGLTYASYLVVARRALCSMPIEWQEQFVDLMRELHERLPEGTLDGDYMVKLRVDGKFAKDPLAEYKHCGPLPLREPPCAD